jgi:ATPase family protein associated with various cellular activities (AAA)
MKTEDVTILLKKAILNRSPVLLKGAPGTGKTALVEQAVAQAGARLIVSHPVVDDPVDYKGFPFVIKDFEGNEFATFLPFGNLKAAIEAKELTVYFFDDLGQANPSVQAACMQPLHARKINGHDISKHIVFIGATNRKQDKSGVSGILEAVKSRFVTIIEVEADVNNWVRNFALPNGLKTELIYFIRFRPELLHKFVPSYDLNNSPSPRTVFHVNKILEWDLPPRMLHEAILGAAGEGFADEIMPFLSSFGKLPDPDWALANPDKVTIPDDDLSVLFALAGAVARKVKTSNMDRFVKLINRFPKDFSVFSMIDAIKRDETLQSTRGYIDWAVDHQEYL